MWRLDSTTILNHYSFWAGLFNMSAVTMICSVSTVSIYTHKKTHILVHKSYPLIAPPDISHKHVMFQDRLRWLFVVRWAETDLLFLEAISSLSFLMSLRHFSISTTFIPSTEKKGRQNVRRPEEKIQEGVRRKKFIIKHKEIWIQSRNGLNTHTNRQAKNIMVKLLKLPVTIGFTASDFSWHSASL